MTIRILVVEDDADIREAFRELLQEQGHEVRTAPNGSAALELLGTGTLPAVILLDLMMPIMDGFEFRKRQLADLRLAQIPVIALTADRGATSEDVGGAPILRKPFSFDEVLVLIEQSARQGGAKAP